MDANLKVLEEVWNLIYHDCHHSDHRERQSSERNANLQDGDQPKRQWQEL